jgi:hypothetical protein
MLSHETMITLDIDPDLADKLAFDFDRRQQLQDRIVEELSYAEVHYKVYIDSDSHTLQLVIDLAAVVGSIEDTLDLFDDHDTPQEDQTFD